MGTCRAWGQDAVGEPAPGAEPPLPQASESEERSQHRAVTEAMQVIGFSAEEMGSVRRILAAILHLVSLLPCPHTAQGL